MDLGDKLMIKPMLIEAPSVTQVLIRSSEQPSEIRTTSAHTLATPYYRWENRGLRKASKLPKITQSVNDNTSRIFSTA